MFGYGGTKLPEERVFNIVELKKMKK